MEEVRRNLIKKQSNLEFSVGDVLDLVYEDRGGHWKIRKFTGICISFSRKNLPRCTLRNVFNGISVELSFDFNSTNLISLTQASRYKSFNIRRSKLYYLRARRLMESKV